jgi:hypothetical protein
VHDATTWQDWVLFAGTIASAGAAFGAVVYARLTVGESRALRGEDRLERLSQLVVDYGDRIQTQMAGPPDRATVIRARLRVAIVGASVALPACEALLELDPSSDPTVVLARTTAALDELACTAPPVPRRPRWLRRL